jgi:signal transduction histidine kinase
MGLAAAIEWQANEFSSRTGIACRASVSESGRSLTGDLTTAAFRILQECLTNITRHADARNVNVTFREDGEILVMAVQDDGKGFSGGAASSSLGMLGMNERAKACGGELLIESSAGSGTTITLRVPIGQMPQI